MIAKVAEDERLEQLTAQKKRIKMLQLRKEVEQAIQERRQKRAEEMQLITKLLEAEMKSNEDRCVYVKLAIEYLLSIISVIIFKAETH